MPSDNDGSRRDGEQKTRENAEHSPGIHRQRVKVELGWRGKAKKRIIIRVEGEWRKRRGKEGILD
jgi:hypothetical protein